MYRMQREMLSLRKRRKKSSYNLGEPHLVLSVGEDEADPIGVPRFEPEHEIEQRVAEPALGGVELKDSRLFPARQREGQGAMLGLPLLLPGEGAGWVFTTGGGCRGAERRRGGSRWVEEDEVLGEGG